MGVESEEVTGAFGGFVAGVRSRDASSPCAGCVGVRRMDYVMAIVAVLAVLCLLGAGWIMTLLGLPGNWFMLLGIAVVALLVPETWRIDIGWWTVGALMALAVVGEILESLTVAWGTSRAGGSRRAALLALCGSIGGGIVGAVVGLPIPVIGSVVAVLLGASFGATAGAMVGESWKGRTAEQGWEVGKAAFWGRLFGTLGKIVTASVMVAVVLAALVARP